MMRLFGKTRREQGDAAEEQARCYLEKNGAQTLARNVRSRYGEIDLVMQLDDTLLFVEVRYRHSTSYGGAAASVDNRKQQRLIATAQYYLQRHPHDGPCRFDVVAIGSTAGDVEWLQNAFEQNE